MQRLHHFTNNNFNILIRSHPIQQLKRLLFQRFILRLQTLYNNQLILIKQFRMLFMRQIQQPQPHMFQIIITTR